MSNELASPDNQQAAAERESWRLQREDASQRLAVAQRDLAIADAKLAELGLTS
jgi:hypothetical protein